MCRNIKTLFNFEPHASTEEIQAAAMQYVRKISGFNKPSQKNEKIFNQAVLDIAHISGHLLEDLVATTEPHDRKIEEAKAHERAVKRFGLQK